MGSKVETLWPCLCWCRDGNRPIERINPECAERQQDWRTHVGAMRLSAHSDCAPRSPGAFVIGHKAMQNRKMPTVMSIDSDLGRHERQPFEESKGWGSVVARCQHLPAMPPRPTYARTHQTDGPRRLVANAISHTACRTHHGLSALSHIAAGAALMCCAHYEEHCSVRCTAHRDSANRGNVPAATVVGSLSAETEKRGSIEMTSAFCSLTPRSLHFTSFTACDTCRSSPKKCRKAEAQCGPGGN